MTSRLIVNSIRHTGASADAITLDNSGNATFPANVTCSGTATGFASRFQPNLIINGAMQVAARGTSSTSSGYQTVDRWRIDQDSGITEACTQSQIALSSSDTPYASGFRYAFRITNGNQTSQDANDYIVLRQKIEAQNMACSGWNYTSASSYVTLSFWVKASVAQTMYVRLLSEDSPGGEQYSFAFSATTSWTKITKTIPGASGVIFNNDNGTGLNLSIIPFYGTSYTTSSHTNDVWENQNGADQTPDFANTWFSVNDATLDVTGVQLEVGSAATDFDHKSFAEELSLCQRYFQKYVHIANNSCIGTGLIWSGTQVRTPFMYLQEMRAAPSFTSSTASGFQASNGDQSRTASALSLSSICKTHGIIIMTTSSGLTQSNPIFMDNMSNGGTDSFFALDAEL